MFFTGTVSPQRYEYICKRYGFKNDGSQDNEIIKKNTQIIPRKNQETNRKIGKALVRNGKRTYQYKKNTPTWIILCRRRTNKMAINKIIIRKLDRRIQILRKICQ